MYDRLAHHFGPQNVFRDIDSIPLSVSFPRFIRETLENTKVVLAVIGPDWLTLCDESGKPRINNPKDFVRLEIEAAIALGMPIIPVAVRFASIPPGDALPESIRLLAEMNGMAVRPDPDFHRDMSKLLDELESLGIAPVASVEPFSESQAEIIKELQELKRRFEGSTVDSVF